MTQASSLYTLSRRVAGNLAYAIMATIVARRTQFHRARLMESITVLSPPFVLMRGGLVSGMMRHGANIAAAQTSANTVISGMVNSQATMMAYNDVYSTLYIMFLLVIPLVWIIPSAAFPKVKHGPSREAEAD